MTNLDFDRWPELGLRRELTPQEWAECKRLITENPQQKSELELELLLNRTLRKLPNKPVSSNFTQLVMQAVHQDVARTPAWPVLRWWHALDRLGWIRPVALAGLVLCAGGFSYQQHVRHVRLEMAQSLLAISMLMPESSPETVRDFEVIHRLSLVNHTAPNAPVMNASAPADLALLAAFQ